MQSNQSGPSSQVMFYSAAVSSKHHARFDLPQHDNLQSQLRSLPELQSENVSLSSREKAKFSQAKSKNSQEIDECIVEDDDSPYSNRKRDAATT